MIIFSILVTYMVWFRGDNVGEIGFWSLLKVKIKHFRWKNQKENIYLMYVFCFGYFSEV